MKNLADKRKKENKGSQNVVDLLTRESSSTLLFEESINQFLSNLHQQSKERNSMDKDEPSRHINSTATIPLSESLGEIFQSLRGQVNLLEEKTSRLEYFMEEVSAAFSHRAKNKK